MVIVDWDVRVNIVYFIIYNNLFDKKNRILEKYKIVSEIDVNRFLEKYYFFLNLKIVFLIKRKDIEFKRLFVVLVLLDNN